MRIRIDKRFIMGLRTRKGGFTNRAFKLLGVRMPPEHGWIQRSIGKEIEVSQSEIDEARVTTKDNRRFRIDKPPRLKKQKQKKHKRNRIVVSTVKTGVLCFSEGGFELWTSDERDIQQPLCVAGTNEAAARLSMRRGLIEAICQNVTHLMVYGAVDEREELLGRFKSVEIGRV